MALTIYTSKDNQWRECLNPLRGLTLERIVQYIEQGERGAFADLQWFYQAMEKSDALTGITVPEVLRASHCKPWADCDSDSERLDVFNGLLLCANLDALFDRGLITFDDAGVIVLSPRLIVRLVCLPVGPSARRLAMGGWADGVVRACRGEHEKPPP